MIAVSTEVLLQLCALADQLGSEERLDTEDLRGSLDPSGWHALGVSESSDSYHRCFVYAKMKDVSEPQRLGSLDVNVIVWKMMETMFTEEGVANG